MPSYEAADLPPVWSLDEAIAGLVDTLGFAFPAPFGMADTFRHFLSQGNSWCPGGETFLGIEALEGCVVEDWWFLGIGGFNLFESMDGEDLQQTLYLLGDLQISGPGESLEVGGHWEHFISNTGNVARFEGEMTGSWSSPSTSQEPWLQAKTSAWIAYHGTHDRDADAVPVLGLFGGLSFGIQAVDFQSLTWGEEGCSDQPRGAVAWQDPGLAWWRLDLSSCTGSGPLKHNGEPQAQDACVDMAEFALAVGRKLAP
jgi:hypothetical protein